VFEIVGIPQKLWEPALLAMAVGQANDQLSDPPLSLASQLPQGARDCWRYWVLPQNL
jgi:hypothetical protein